MVHGAARRDRDPMPITPSSPDPDSPASPDPDAPTTEAGADEAPTTQHPHTEQHHAPADEAPRRLLRSRDDRVIGGVCGGIARYFRIDPLIVRIAAVALAFVGGAAIVAYLAALLLVPEDDGAGRPVDGRPSRVATIAGACLIVLAGIALLDGSWGLHFGWALGSLVPLTVLAILIALAGQRLLRRRGEDQPTIARIVGAGLLLCGLLVAAGLLAIGAGWATASGGGTAVAIVVIALGVAMVGLSFRTSRARWLVVPALVLAIPAGVVSAAGIDAHGGVGDRSYQPVTAADIEPGGYRLGTGELVVDLRDMRWPAGDPVTLKVDVGIGHALVLVPRDVCVQATTHAGMGYVNILGAESGGADINDANGSVSRATGPKLVLHGDVGLGAFEVRHTRDYSDNARPERISAGLAEMGCAGVRA
jgi:phage shock protein PspC (stress-responsive transcriptional regulator)